MTADKRWVDLIPVADLEEGWVTRVTLGSRLLAVYDTVSGFYVTTALCSHAAADMCDGYFDGHVIECPLHQGAFDVRTGKPVSAPATRPIRTFEARVSGPMLQIEV